ncbi:MAG: DUF350 domain-containing protein [Proteobacteria bacterium]|nr:DUF350 domain-containing protein [Pseudomonadota bacterium]
MFDNYLIWVIAVMCLDLVLAVMAISAFRYLQGVLEGINTTHELSKKDNFAFGIAFAGSALALAMIIAATIDGAPDTSIVNEAINVVIYAVAGMVLLRIGAWVNDLIIFNRFSLKDEISNENISAGIVQAANYLSLGIIISASIKWIETESYEGLVSVIFVFISSQLILLMITRLRAQIYLRRHDGKRLQDALKEGNPALAIRYAGHIIAAALGVSASAHLVSYMQATPWVSAGIWFLVSIVIVIVITLLASVARRCILLGINTVEEVDEQKNTGVAFIEAQIFISMAIILNPLMNMLDSIL